MGSRLLASSIAVAGLIACGPVRSTGTIIDAAAELNAAETAQGRELSPYEMVAAEAYLHKAREEQSYSDFEVSEAMAQRARDCARVARARAERAMRQGLGAAEIADTTAAICLAGPPGARPPQGLSVPVVTAKTAAATATPAPTPAAKPGEKPKPAAKKPNEPADPALPEGE